MRLTFIVVASVVLSAASLRAAVVDFSDQPLPSNSYDNGSGHPAGFTGFTSGGAFLNNSYDSTYDSWIGWSLSAVNAPTPYDPVNGPADSSGNHQYASAPGGGVGGPNDTYAVGYYDGYDPTYINLPAGTHPLSVDLTNTLYDAESMKDGDSFAKKFGPTDFFTATLTGYTGAAETGVVTGSVNFQLASNGNIVTDWTNVDLETLGNASSIGLTFESSDVGLYGINTPTYVALDNLTVTPEPAAGALLLFAGASSLVVGRRHQKRTYYATSASRD